MKLRPSEIEDDSTSILSENQKTSEQFLSQRVPGESIESELKIAKDIPEPFRYFKPSNIQTLALKFSPYSTETTDILLENIIVEYKSITSIQYQETQGEITYLKTYASVGIPLSRYMWLLKTLSKLLGFDYHPLYTFKDKEYIWVSAQLPYNDPIYQDPKCYIYDTKENDTIAIGTLHDVMKDLKSNVMGYGRFQVRHTQNFEKQCVINFLLTGFQMTALTKIQSYPKPCVVVAPSNELLESLNSLKLNDDKESIH